MDYKNVKLEIEGSIAKITLKIVENRKFPTLDMQTGKDLLAAIKECEANDQVRVLIITGTGKAFSAGGDIKQFKESLESGKSDELMDELTEDLYQVAYELKTLRIPVIAAVNGYAIGAGMNLALSCDIIIASEKARFAESFINLALIPGFAGTYYLPRLLPWPKMAEICFFGEMLSASEMEKLGLVNKVVPPEKLEVVAREYAERLVNQPTLAIGRMKKLFIDGLNKDFKNAIEDERKIQIKCTKSEDYKEGVFALNEKRKPSFIGK
ncbi:MAG: enoyl-CoA hydratase/isomerase family protein [Candidatus Helarchaeota archaeon]|nr:enoyl-CoA hydratase/isomerase family protein [Candidatus Helarchaeota archaeon]